MNLKETAETYKNILSVIERQLTPYQEEPLGISDALKLLRINLGSDCYLSIDPPTVHWHTGNDAPNVDSEGWRVYDGKRSYKGKTLRAAVQECLHSSAEQSDTVEDISNAIDLAGAAPHGRTDDGEPVKIF